MDGNEVDSLSATFVQITRAIQGDKIALNDLSARTWTFLVSKAERHPLFPRIARWMDAEDLAQAVIGRICEAGNLQTFSDQRTGAWYRFATTVLDRVIIDQLRRDGAEKRIPPTRLSSLDSTGAVLRDPPAREPSHTSVLCAADLLATCRAVLNERQGAILVQRVHERREFEEIAADLGVTTAAVRSSFNRLQVILDRVFRPGKDVTASVPRSASTGDKRADSITDS